jgi:peroxiredoxin
MSLVAIEGTMNHADAKGIPLTDPDGKQTTLGAFRGDPLVVILVRYFGCLPCQQYLVDLDGQPDAVAPPARIVAIGGSAAYQARWLRDIKGVHIPLLLDSDNRVRAVVELGDLTGRQLSRSGRWANYAKAVGAGFRPQVPTKDARRAPGIALFDRDFSPVWVHRGEMMGDYPPIQQLLDRVLQQRG